MAMHQSIAVATARGTEVARLRIVLPRLQSAVRRDMFIGSIRYRVQAPLGAAWMPIMIMSLLWSLCHRRADLSINISHLTVLEPAAATSRIITTSTTRAVLLRKIDLRSTDQR